MLYLHRFVHAWNSESSRIDIHTRDCQATEYFEIYGRPAWLTIGASVSAG
jgi:hypothetical protein